MDTAPHVIVINLLRSVDRRAHIVQQLKAQDLEFSVLAATDKLSLTLADRSRYDDALAKRTAGRSLTDGEIACVLSHARAWRIIVDKGWESAVILEDDALLDERFPRVIRALKRFPTDWGLINFRSDGAVEKVSKGMEPGLDICRFTARMNGTAGYVISRKVASIALGLVFPICRAADGLFAYLRHRGDFVAYGTRPQMIRLDDALHPSDIGNRGMGGSPITKGSLGVESGTKHALKGERIGIAVSTFSHEKTSAQRYQIIDQSLNSLLASTHHFDASSLVRLIVVDGPVPQAHERLLERYSGYFSIVRRPINGGAARAKNSAIRILLDEGVTIGFLLDDDVSCQRGWLEQYTAFCRSMNVHHVAGFAKQHFFPEGPKWQELNMRYESHGKWRIIKHRGAHGHLLTFTPELIEKIGYFKVYPGKMGGWHANFTYRAVRAGLGGFPWAVDLADGEKYIEHIGQDDSWVWGKPNDLASVSRHTRNLEWIKNQEFDFFVDPYRFIEAED